MMTYFWYYLTLPGSLLSVDEYQKPKKSSAFYQFLIYNSCWILMILYAISTLNDQDINQIVYVNI
mgnify:CR=1 FL=1